MLPESSVLIAVMNDPRDLERARVEHWYRIPVRSAPKFFPPDYIAFYCTKPLGQEAYSIRWYAPVRGHELREARGATSCPMNPTTRAPTSAITSSNSASWSNSPPFRAAA